MLRAKTGKHYETAGTPVDLVLYYGNADPKTWEFPPPGDFEPWVATYMQPEIDKGTGDADRGSNPSVRQRIWWSE